MKCLVAFLTVLAFYAIADQPAQAVVTRVCLVSYKNELGYSKEYKMHVKFLTGYELNGGTQAYNYNHFHNYALIRFGNGNKAIVKIERMVWEVGQEFGSDDFKKLFDTIGETEATQINPATRKKWKIKGKSHFDWVDPHVVE